VFCELGIMFHIRGQGFSFLSIPTGYVIELYPEGVKKYLSHS
jgi:hypothetical protein